MTLPANTQDNPTQASADNYTNSEIACTTQPGTRKAGRPKDPNAKIVQQIALRPDDWTYAALWAIDSYNIADNPSTRMERMISRLRSMAPKGPDAFGFERDPTKAPAPRTTPAVAREAAQRGISKAELINEMYAIYKQQKRGKND